MQAKIIEVSRSVLSITGIKIDRGAGLGWGSCTDDNVKPFRATVASSFLGKATLEESEQEVDEWVAKLHAHGWSTPQQTSNNATRYLTGPGGFSLAITPHLNPQAQSGADLQISSACIVTDDMANSPGADITHELQP